MATITASDTWALVTRKRLDVRQDAMQDFVHVAQACQVGPAGVRARPSPRARRWSENDRTTPALESVDVFWNKLLKRQVSS